MNKEQWERLTNCEKLRCRICDLDVSESTSNKLAFELANIEDEISELQEENERLEGLIELMYYKIQFNDEQQELLDSILQGEDKE